MAKITKSLSTKIDKQTGKVEIMFRFIAGFKKVYRAKSGIFIDPKQWNEKKGELKTSTYGKQEVEIKQKLEKLCTYIVDTFTDTQIDEVNSKWLQTLIITFHHGDKATPTTNHTTQKKERTNHL